MTQPATLRIRKVPTGAWSKAIEAMHTLCFPADVHEDYSVGTWWLAFDGHEPVAFAGMKPVESAPGWVYFSRVGVLPGYRGRGLQARFMRAIEREARRTFRSAVISTTYSNPPSANNFIRQGYRMYTPETPWGCDGTCYWIKTLTYP